jgi:riboflavin transporter FmnP
MSGSSDKKSKQVIRPSKGRIMTTSRLITLAMLCAMAYTVMFVFKSTPPLTVVPPLKFDPKDVVIMLGGFLFGPLSALMIITVVSFLEMLSASTTGWWGFLMNIVSSASFVCTASLIYRKRRTMVGAIVGLTVGVITVTGMMSLWNYLIVPIYTGWPRSAVVPLLLPVFVPFNLFKSGLNAALIVLLFKPLATALRKAELIEPGIVGKRTPAEKLAKWIFITLSVIMVTVVFIISFLPRFLPD